MLTHLSPTTYIKYMNCPHQVYLQKVLKLGEHGMDQSMAMATGSAFDAIVKCALNRRLKLNEILTQQILPKNQAAVILAQTIYDEFYRHGPLKALRNEGIGYTAAEQEVELEFEGQKSICLGLPDLVMTDGTVVDWKVNGAFGGGQMPREGYIRCFMRGKDDGPHVNWEFTMEQVHLDWAVQLYLYSRILGHIPGRPLKVGVEQIAVDRNNDVRCASFRNQISPEFQLATERGFHQAFKALSTGTVPAPHYTTRRCIQYNKLCGVANVCDGYRTYQYRQAVQPGLSLLRPGSSSEASSVQSSDGSLCFAVRSGPKSNQSNPTQPPVGPGIQASS